MSTNTRARTALHRTRTALRWVGVAEQVTGGLLVAMILVLMLVQAGQRYLPVDGWLWTGELARFGLVWLTFAMAGYLMGRDEHISLKLVDFATTGLVRHVVRALGNVVVAVVCVGYALEAYELLQQPLVQTTPSLGMPVNWLYAIPFAGLSLTALRAAAAVVDPPEAGDARPGQHTPVSGGPIG